MARSQASAWSSSDCGWQRRRCASILADWGADVVKIEPIGGDPFRGLAWAYGGEMNPPFELDNRGRRPDRPTAVARTILFLVPLVENSVARDGPACSSVSFVLRVICLGLQWPRPLGAVAAPVGTRRFHHCVGGSGGRLDAARGTSQEVSFAAV